MQRVARRFGVVAAAGELASAHGLTGWQPGEALDAVGKCFSSWLDGFGGLGNKEERALLDQVRAFFQRHGSSRFERLDGYEDQKVIDRAGFRRGKAGSDLEYLVMSEAFKEMCKGHDFRAAAKVLRHAGMLEPDREGKNSQSIRVKGIRERYYVFPACMLSDEPERASVDDDPLG